MNPAPSRLVLLGHPVAHSLSPRFQNAALESAGIPLRYETLDVPPSTLGATLQQLTTAGAAGNVTIPHKEQVAVMCDVLSPIARRARAVNTFWTVGRQLVGDNTDVVGFNTLAARLGADTTVRTVAVIGAGGAAAAVLTAVEQWGGPTVRLHNRSPARAQALAERFAPLVDVVDDAESAVRGAAVVVNATSVGMASDEDPVRLAALDPGAIVIDLVYRPGETGWVRRARERGHPAADGLEMLLAQGAAAFERWFGMKPDVAAMRAAVGV
jgi:shikimate dehydrogenase